VRTLLPPLVLCLLSACMAPEMQERKIDRLVHCLVDVHQWDPRMGANQNGAYMELMKEGEAAVPGLARAILDERKTMILDRQPDHIPLVGDVAFLMCIKLTGRRISEFREAGVRMARDSNPIFGLEFEDGARARARDMFLQPR
jgi:hypothetical protein